MPKLTIWSLRAALIDLALGFTFGALLLAHKGLNLSPAFWAVLPAHIEFLLFGWTAQLILAVAYWILPRFSHQPKRGNYPLALAAFVLLNLGVLLAGLGPLCSPSAWLPLLGRTAQVAAGLAFALHAWPRIKAPGA